MTETQDDPLVNVEAEQAVLGCLLVAPDDIWRVPRLGEAHFRDPVHARIFAAIRRQIETGGGVDATLLKHLMADDEGLAQIGGPRYLARLAGATISVRALPDYADAVIGLAVRRRLRDAGGALAAAVSDPSGDMDAALAAFEAERAATEDTAREKPRTRTAYAIAGDVVEEANEAVMSGTRPGAFCGLGPLDNLIGGFQPGRHVVLAGRPGMGKSAIACAAAWRLAERGWPVLFPTCEMDPDQLMRRILSEVAAERLDVQMPHAAIEAGDLTDHQMRGLIDAAGLVQDWPLWIHDAPGVRVGALASEVRTWARRQEGRPVPPVVFLDYLQLVSGSNAKANRTQEVGEVSRSMKALARSTGACVVSLAQVNREVEKRDDKRPILSDLRDSGEIEQDADAVLFAFREEYYAERDEPKAGGRKDDGLSEEIERHALRLERVRGLVEIICAKRRGGPTGSATLRCNLALNRFWEDG